MSKFGFIMRKFLKILAYFLGFILVLLLVTIKPLDREKYTEKAHYKQFKTLISGFKPCETKGELRAGWAKLNITPAKPMAMAGYGNRRGKPYTAVHDSVFVRAIAIEINQQKTFFLSADLLIIPPSVNALLESKLKSLGIDIQNVHFGATHSHNSLGSWGNTVTGKLFAGPYDPKIEPFLVEKICKVLQNAQSNLAPAKIAYGEIIDKDDIKNRLEIAKPEIDPEIRSLQIVQKTGKKAQLVTYAAHSTVLNSATFELSRDYSGVLVDKLEKENVDFAMFMAGAVGSMGPIEKGMNDFDEVNNQGLNVYNHVLNLKYAEVENSIFSTRIELPMAAASAKISQNFALRSWVFKYLFGDFPTYLKITKIGKTLFIGTPCDFSGELMIPLDAYAKSKGLDLVITSFDGSYVGYITKDEHYDLDLYETRTMNWFGPENGAYFSEVIRSIVDKVGN
jgi:neutral ceramidase